MPAVTAAWPSPTASIVLPTPGGPIRSTLAASSMNRRVARPALHLGSTEGWAEKSKSARVNGDGSYAKRSRLPGPRDHPQERDVGAELLVVRGGVHAVPAAAGAAVAGGKAGRMAAASWARS